MARTLTISQACFELRTTAPHSYNQVRRLIELGRLQGGQRDDRTWWVDADDLARYQRELSDRTAGSPSAA